MPPSELPPEENKAFLENEFVPAWLRILNLDASRFERSRYAGESVSSLGKHRIKDINILRELTPGIYESAAEEVKEYSDALFQTRGGFRKYNLGRKLGTIPMQDIALHPELANDHRAQDAYFRQYPELKTKET